MVARLALADVALRHQQRDRHFIDRDRTAVLTRLRAVALVVAAAHGRLPASSAVPTRFSRCP